MIHVLLDLLCRNTDVVAAQTGVLQWIDLGHNAQLG